MGKHDELHTCHNECERPACVLRRKVATLEAELAAMKARGDRLAEELRQIYVDASEQHGDWCNLPPVDDEARNFAFDISQYALAALKEADQ